MWRSKLSWISTYELLRFPPSLMTIIIIIAWTLLHMLKSILPKTTDLTSISLAIKLFSYSIMRFSIPSKPLFKFWSCQKWSTSILQISTTFTTHLYSTMCVSEIVYFLSTLSIFLYHVSQPWNFLKTPRIKIIFFLFLG